MAVQNNFNECTKAIIRNKLSGFITRRQHAYDAMTKRGYTVPDLARKNKAIAALRDQLEASRDWSLRSHLLWICAMRHLITTLLPYEFHDDAKQVKYRKRIVDLLNYCEDLCKKFVNHKLTAA